MKNVSRRNGFQVFKILMVIAALMATWILSSPYNANAYEVGVEWINDFPGTGGKK